MMRFFCTLTTDDDRAWQEGEDEPAITGDIVFRGEWDGVSDKVMALYGRIPERGIPFLGWPQVAA